MTLRIRLAVRRPKATTRCLALLKSVGYQWLQRFSLQSFSLSEVKGSFRCSAAAEPGQNRTYYGLTWVVANPRNGKRCSRLFAFNEAERRVLATSWKGAPQSIEHGIETAPVTLC